jgi:hypothetical protein
MAASKAETKFWNGLMGRLGKSPTSLNLAEGGLQRNLKSPDERLNVVWRSWILAQGDLKQLGSRLARQCIMHSGHLFSRQ